MTKQTGSSTKSVEVIIEGMHRHCDRMDMFVRLMEDHGKSEKEIESDISRNVFDFFAELFSLIQRNIRDDLAALEEAIIIEAHKK